jgi:predicted secreted protein
MREKHRNFIISLVITGILVAFIFLLNDRDTALGASFGAYVKLRMSRYISIIAGTAALLIAIFFRLNKKNGYTNNLFYILPGVLNIMLGIGGIIYAVSSPNGNMILHDFLLNLLLGVLILADVFLNTVKN